MTEDNPTDPLDKIMDYMSEQNLELEKISKLMSFAEFQIKLAQRAETKHDRDLRRGLALSIQARCMASRHWPEYEKANARPTPPPDPCP